MIQHTQEWIDARRGYITGSRFGDVMTNPKKKTDALSKTAESYMNELIAEYLTGEPQGFPGNRATEWGNLYEDEARAAYTWETGRQVEQVGFIEHPTESLVGCSPDGLIGPKGLLEGKCPHNSAIHIHNVIKREIPKEYVPQVQGNIWVCEREWADFVSFDPRISDKCSIVIVRVERDDKYIKKLTEKVADFRELLITRLEELTDVRF